ADVPANAPSIDGPLRAGAGYTGLVDELEVSTAARGADWMRFSYAAQAADAKLVAAVTQGRDSAEGDSGGGGYIGVLVTSLAPDAKVVIALLGVMFVVAAWVMVSKALYIRSVESGNDGFLRRFRESIDVLAAEGSGRHPNSPLARLYDAGCGELTKRD